MINEIYKKGEISEMARALFKEERSKKRIDGWFLAREIIAKKAEGLKFFPREVRAALELSYVINELPLTLSENAVFAGTQADAFARTYALINPAFRVETFSGYCDPTSVYGDIERNEEFTEERIAKVREYTKETDYVKALTAVYDEYDEYTSEVVFFIEQVTGHLIPDFKYAIKNGVYNLIYELKEKHETETDETKIVNYEAMIITLEAVVNLAKRYKELALEQLKTADEPRKKQLRLLIQTLNKVPEFGAETLYEAIQSFLLLWQVMCIEQTPNPFAFSVGNADRIFEPYRANDNMDRETASELFKHFLVFFNVGDRSWAISQNVILSGKDKNGRDLTNETTYALLDAYADMNLPQPILSVKLHKNTPEMLYAELGRFFFTPGVLTPSLFNDDSVFDVLLKNGVQANDLENYSVAGCQEPLIMGKDNGNTTNSWLNLAKILEVTLNESRSSITGKKIGDFEYLSAEETLRNIRELFYKNTKAAVEKMTAAANGATKAVSYLPVPFLSVFMGGMESGYDIRDTEHRGTAYNGSGCLIHGLSVVADSFVAIDSLLREKPEYIEVLPEALRKNFEGYDALREYLKSCPKFGNNISVVDDEAAEIANRVSDIVTSARNNWGNPFRADWSSPTTHLLYGYCTGATPDGRGARNMLNYGVDPLYGDAAGGMGFRMLSALKLPYEKMNGGYASHLGIDPKYFRGETVEEKGIEFRDKIVKPLFFNEYSKGVSPFYLYVNVTTPEILRKVLADPKKYAPSGVYIMRIHGTFVNFLDLSPAIQEDIITRLDLQSTALC